MGVLRSVWSSDADIDVDCYAYELGRYKEEDIDRINNVYDMYIIPLADAFRNDFIVNLDNLTRFINKLKIPVYVLSVGIRAEYDPDLRQRFIFNDAVKRFVKAVLNHSSCIGLRGVITAKYLQNLGFEPERDFTVIGCPSLYIYGEDIFVRDSKFDEFSSMSINFNPNIVDIDSNLLKIAKKQHEYYVVGQNIAELKCLRLGISDKKIESKWYFADINHELYKENHMRGFLTAGDWIRYMKRIDYSVGGKFHGNVAAILGGAKTLFIPSDARMQELVSFHKLPSIPSKQWNRISFFEEIIESVDFESHIKQHKDNFFNYVGFLEKIGLPSVWSLEEKPKEELLLFSRTVNNCLFTDKATQINIWNDYMTRFERKYKQK